MPDLAFLVFLDTRSRGDEMPDLTFLSSWTQEVKCQTSIPERQKSSYWTQEVELEFPPPPPSCAMDTRSRGDEMPDLTFLSSWMWSCASAKKVYQRHKCY